MTLATWLTLIIVLGVVWGGLALILSTAIRKERSKTEEETEVFPTP